MLAKKAIQKRKVLQTEDRPFDLDWFCLRTAFAVCLGYPSTLG